MIWDWLKRKEDDMKMLFILYLYSFLNIPYRWGGDDPIEGFDCSGAVIEWMAYLGIQPPKDMTAQQLYYYYSHQNDSDTKDLGTLVFYGKSLAHISHVALMIDQEKVIEFGGGNQFTRSEQQAANQNAFARIRHYTHRKDLLAVVKPKGVPW